VSVCHFECFSKLSEEFGGSRERVCEEGEGGETGIVEGLLCMA
jgi:hypothetical protein